MKKFTETIADDDYRNSDGLLVCGRCGTPKEMRLSTELLGGHTAIVPIPCECMKRAEAERRERELAAERKRKIERARTECFAGCAFFRGCTFDADDGRTPQIAAICKGYADTFSRDDMNGLLLWGKVGTGKSFFASAIANRVIDLGFSALQTSVQDIVTHIESVPFNERENAKSRLLKYDLASAIANRVIDLGFSALQTSVQDIVTHIESVPFNERENAKSRLLKYDLLVIDDLGAHRSTDYVMGHVYDIIDSRYKNRRPMVVTTNLDPNIATKSDADDAPWPRIFTRILERCAPIKFAGENRREYKMMEMREAMRKRLGL